MDDLENRFKYHKPQTARRGEEHNFIREACRGLAEDFAQSLPDGREKSLAITKVEEAMFWANAALARTPDVPTVERPLSLFESVPFNPNVDPATGIDMRMHGPDVREEVSDGYHTFRELYDHRRALTAALAVSVQDSWRSRKHHPQGDPMFDGYFIVGIDLPNGTITYHYKNQFWDDFADLREIEHAPKWDGTSPETTVTRLLDFARADRLTPTHPGLDGAQHIGHMEECGPCETFAKIHDPGPGNYGPGQPRARQDEGVFEAHLEGMDCGRRPCTQCEGPAGTSKMQPLTPDEIDPRDVPPRY